MTSADDRMNSLKECLREGEYEAQLFETASYCLFQEIKELTLSDIKKATNKLQEKLISKCGTPDEVSKSEDLIQQLRIKHEESVDTYFKDLEVTVRKIFCIPSHILLPEDAIQSEQYTDEDMRKVDNEIKNLTSRYRRAVCMESLLKKEKKSSTCVDIVERRTLEIEDNIAVLESMFQRNTHGWTILSEELKDLFNLFNRLNPFSLAKSVDSEKYLIEKLHSST